MRRQQEDSEKDSRWLQQQEDNIKKRLSIASLTDVKVEPLNGGANHVAGKPPVAERTPISPRIPVDQQSSSSNASSPQPLNDKKIDRANDPVYKCTTNVVKAIMSLSSGVEQSKVGEYLELVKRVGLDLRELLGTVDQLTNSFPAQTHKWDIE